MCIIFSNLKYLYFWVSVWEKKNQNMGVSHVQENLNPQGKTLALQPSADTIMHNSYHSDWHFPVYKTHVSKIL